MAKDNSSSSDGPTFDVFISYAATDEEHATGLYNTLTSRGLSCFLAKKDLAGGDDFADRIREALHGSKELCLLATPNSISSEGVASEWVATEWGAGWALQKRITPILLDRSPSQLPPRLRALHCVRFDNVGAFATQFHERSGRRAPSITQHELSRTEERILQNLTHEFDLRLQTEEIAQKLRMNSSRARHALTPLSELGFIQSEGFNPRDFHYITRQGIEAVGRTLDLPFMKFRLFTSRQLRKLRG